MFLKYEIHFEDSIRNTTNYFEDSIQNTTNYFIFRMIIEWGRERRCNIIYFQSVKIVQAKAIVDLFLSCCALGIAFYFIWQFLEKMFRVTVDQIIGRCCGTIQKIFRILLCVLFFYWPGCFCHIKPIVVTISLCHHGDQNGNKDNFILFST